MHRNIEDIKQKITTHCNQNTTYIHPSATNIYIAQLISAYSNGKGGDIIFGARFDGKVVEVKENKFPISIEEILKVIKGKIDIYYNKFYFEQSELFYISINTSEELVTVNDVPYKLNHSGELTELVPHKVFISYTHKDSDLADILEGVLTTFKNVIVTRDIKVTQYKDDLNEFMRTIRKHDMVIAIVSDGYLKSLNCMYEVTELMKDEDYQQRLNFIVVRDSDSRFYNKENLYDGFKADIYNPLGKAKYLSYWDKKQKKMEEEIKELNIRTSMLGDLSNEMKKMESVLPSLDNFLSHISGKIGKSFEEMNDENFYEITKYF
ncbi:MULTISPECIES: toll/interleukin-1 receptor domain-containing protein [unclassified Paenibacillus]|uniref:toll/interleukin-1 receptor domain-containing protein n=1 Tax=unclassified Paenibacillus TaxID=185978 RepID=UPI001AE49172|nr:MULTISPECIES: toll/interleukin-1 receptor domain-containing protein [unclassified Paenibacillus]MBP1153645.1 hypothetical protein [Paenibacillus sp. PvP091]MBP1170970.1 hypothetical protein [Paenibacillus sp. PvR098]MBP2441998.1 hypothetical protein [Paenibacillus sp. PvP052]